MYLCKLIMCARMEKKTDIKIQFSGLKPGVYEYEYHLDNTFFEPFENDDLRECEVDFKVRLEKKERLMVFDFFFTGTTELECDRCLKKLSVPLSGEQTLFVKFGEVQENEDENVVYLPEDESMIDLAQWMYEFVAVTVPMVHIHPEDENGNPTCDPDMLKYLSADMAATEETDPRWDALKALKDEK